jgi:hypothetical protein
VKVMGTLSAAFVVAGAVAMSFASPAQADPPLFNGVYNADAEGVLGQWFVGSTCATEGCTANITSTSGWSSEATLSGGQWKWTVDNPRGTVCDDGSTFPSTVTYTIDAEALSGTAAGPDLCLTPPGSSSTRITLTKVA